MPLHHGVRRRPGGGVRVTLSPREREALGVLPDSLAPALAAEADEDGPVGVVRRRLFPVAYDDPELEREYRELVGDDLREQRLKALAEFRDTLARGRTSGRSWMVELDADEAQLWLSVLNDARLVFGALLGITSEEQWEAGPDEANPASVLLWYLGWLQDDLVRALMSSLEED